jgi:hypothetical protein
MAVDFDKAEGMEDTEGVGDKDRERTEDPGFGLAPFLEDGVGLANSLGGGRASGGDFDVRRLSIEALVMLVFRTASAWLP